MLPKVAAVVTEYRPGTHADVLLSKFVHGFAMDDGLHPPRVQLAALYIDQFPAGEIGRAFAAEHGIPLHTSIQSALTLNDQQYYADDGAHPDPSGGAPARGGVGRARPSPASARTASAPGCRILERGEAAGGGRGAVP